jgi:hypothetical protein
LKFDRSSPTVTVATFAAPADAARFAIGRFVLTPVAAAVPINQS